MSSTDARAKLLDSAYKGVSKPGSQPPSSSKSQSEENPSDGVKPYEDTKWWLHPKPKDYPVSSRETPWETSEIEAIIGDTSQKKPTVGELGFHDDHPLLSEIPEKLLSESDPQLTGINKTDPWWRTTDSASFGPDKGLASLNHVSDISRFSLDNPLSTTSDRADDLSSSELSKAQLLEALCHSQTRAREAEIEAQKAYDEKQHMITHFLKQASHLFAYKQWLHICQLETTCLHLRNYNRYRLIYTRFPDFVPWVPNGKRQERVRPQPGSPRYKTDRSFGSFLLGLTLVGAGLLLGWTLGWLFR